MIVKKITTIPYNYDIIVIFNDKENNHEEINKVLIKYGAHDEDEKNWIDDAKGWTIDNIVSSIVVINTFYHKSKNSLIVTARHEVHHAAAQVFSYINNPIHSLDEEAFLYLNDWIFHKVLDIIDKNKIM
jgi:hypothetical protein